MSDTNEERLLTDRLRELAQADAAMTPSPDLEFRVMARRDAGNAPVIVPERRRSHAAHLIWTAAGMAAAALLLIALTSRHAPSSTENPAASAAIDEAKPPVVIASSSEPSRGLLVADQPSRRNSSRRRTPAPRQVRPASDVVDFMPLGPMAPTNLSGSFQIVPVRINNTPAHLLLGEDGVAQGILWRSR